MADDEIGYITRVSRTEDEQGRSVLRATVDFYDGNCPPITFGTVIGRQPVKIIVQTNSESRPAIGGAAVVDPTAGENPDFNWDGNG